MDYLRMERRQGHVTCGNRLGIEREESSKIFKLRRGAPPALLRPTGILQDQFVWFDFGKNGLQLNEIKILLNIRVMPQYFSERPELVWL